MKLLLLLGALLSLASISASACSINITTENLFPLFDGSACIDISEISNGQREMVIKSFLINGENNKIETIIMKPGLDTFIVSSSEIPFVGEMKLVEIKVKNLKQFSLKFYNGHSIDVIINQNMQITPSSICIAQEGSSVLKGYDNRCP